MQGSKHPDPQRQAEKQQADERMRDVLVLLEHLAESEETTIKLIMDCLYDVGAVNLINKKFRFKPLNRLIKAIAGISKPIFRFVAFRWFRQKCPELIANWLRSKVAFKAADKKPPSPPPPPVAPPPPAPQNHSPPVVQPMSTAPVASTLQPALPLSTAPDVQEIKRLRTQVRVLTGMLAGTLIALGGTAALHFNNLNAERMQPIHQIQSTTVDPPEP